MKRQNIRLLWESSVIGKMLKTKMYQTNYLIVPNSLLEKIPKNTCSCQYQKSETIKFIIFKQLETIFISLQILLGN